jgi:magnesium transporter
VKRKGINKMPGNLKKTRAKKLGFPPGSFVHVGERKIDNIRISIIDTDQEHFEIHEPDTIEKAFAFKDSPTITWINIDGLHDVEVLEKIGRHYNIHSLIIEDILTTDQRPKIEILDNYIFIVMKLLTYVDIRKEIDIEQVSMILGKNFVMTFQEKEGDELNPVRERLKSGQGRLRKGGCDYLAYAIMDIIIDNYFLVLEKFGEDIEKLEEKVILNQSPNIAHEIQKLRREMIFLRKSIWPLREVVNNLIRSENPLIHEANLPYFRDLYDHTIQIIDTVETYRDLISGILDIFLSSISNRMNEIMKVLTIISTIFIPLTFVAGIYGMNFTNMPELKWSFGYPFVLILMFLIFCGMFFYFRKKKWL